MGRWTTVTPHLRMATGLFPSPHLANQITPPFSWFRISQSSKKPQRWGRSNSSLTNQKLHYRRHSVPWTETCFRPVQMTSTCAWTDFIHPISALFGQLYKETLHKFHCYADDNQLYLAKKAEETNQLIKLQVCPKEIKTWVTHLFPLT